MRSITFISLLILCLGCSSAKNAGSDSHRIRPGKLNGTWVPVRQELGGVLLPGASFEKQKLILGDGVYTLIAESVDKGEVKYTNEKMDIYGKDGVNAGKHFTAIYKYENGQLTVCYNLSGDHYPESFETKGKPMYFLSVFKKS